MIVTVILIRHGKTESNVKDFYMGRSAEDLNSTGLEQANKLAARLESQPVAAVYSSPLQRTLSTAEIISAPHNLRPAVMAELIEINLGDWQGLHIGEVKEKWPEHFSIWRTDPSHFTVPGGESINEVASRATMALNKIAADNINRTVIIVTHEIIVKVLVAYVLGCTNSIYRRFRIDNASLTLVTRKEGHYRLITLNDTGHLEN
jgi:broad specificity phosphatase PhoE